MDIKVSKFRDALGLVKLTVPREHKKMPLKVLTNILLQKGRLVATDMDTMVIVPLFEADLDCLIPYLDAAKPLDYVDGNDILHLELKEGAVLMSWSDGSMKLGTGKVDDFPSVPSEFVPTGEAEIDVDTLIGGMEEVLSYVSKEGGKDARPVLQGVTLILGEHVAVAAGDGFRMAHKPLPTLSFPKEESIIVPFSSVNILRHLWAKTPRTPPSGGTLVEGIMAKKKARLSIDAQGHLRVMFGESATALIKLTAGTPPNWIKLVPDKQPQLIATMVAAQLDIAVRRVRTIAKDGSNIIRMVFSDGTATVSAQGNGQHAEGNVKVLAGNGGSGRVGLNANYLLTYLKGKEGIVTLQLVEEGAPVIFRHQKDPQVLIMPMKVEW
ncbi:MAG: hypothetical protein V2A77_07730 [Pseudomonadota bacterium]